MSVKVHLKLCIAVPVECLIAECRYRAKDFRLIDSNGNSLLFHKTILQNISPKFDYLNKFCGEVDDGFEQMRLQTLGHYALQALYELIYMGPVVTGEKSACELLDQLQVLQLPLITQKRQESFLNYNRVQANGYCTKENNQHLQLTATPNNSLTRRMILPAEDVELLNRHGSNIDEIQETSRTLRWFDLDQIEQRGTQIKRTTADGLSCIKQASVQSKLKRKQDIALHRMTVTSMTSSVKSDSVSREVRELTQSKNTNEKEKFLADFGLFYSPRPITRSLIKAIGMSNDSPPPEENKTLSPSKATPKNSVSQSGNLKYNLIQKTNTATNQDKQPLSRSSANGSSRNTDYAKSSTQVPKSINKSPRKNIYAGLKADSKSTDFSQLARPNFNNNNRNSRGNKESNGRKCNGIKYKSNHKSPNENLSYASEISNDEDTSDSSSSSSSEDEEEDKTDESDDFSDSFDSDTKTDTKKRGSMSKKPNKNNLTRFKNRANKLRYIERKANAMKQIIQAVALALPDKRKFSRMHGYECFICGQLYSASTWKDHILIAHYNMRFYCLKCGVDFKNVISRNKHIKDCSGI